MGMEKEETKKSKVIIITGMHRSGTSLVASLMQSAGVDIGDELMASSPSNIHGHFEDLDFYHFHKEILSEAGKTYLVCPGVSLNISDDKLKQAQALIAKRMDKPLWGWKDPCTTLFLDFWLQLLPDAHFLFVYRHPIDVFLSLLKRADIEITENPASGLKAWQVYNEHILHFMGKHPERSTLCHVMGILQHKEEFNKLVRLRLRLTKTSDIKNRCYADSLHRLSVPDWLTQSIRHIFPQVIELYEQLQAVAHLPFVYSTTGPKSADEDLLPLLNYTTKALMAVHTKLREQGTISLLFKPELFWAGENEEFSAKHAISLSAPMGSDRQNLIFVLPPSANNLQRLRLDPAGRPGFFHLYKVALKWSDLEGKQEELLWQLLGAREIARCSKMEGVRFCTAALGEVFLSTSDDPQIVFEPLKDVKVDAKEGILRLEMEMDWPKSADYLIAEEVFGKEMAVQSRQIQAKDSALEDQSRQIQAKDTHIHNIESELNLMKQSRVWRIAKFFRRLFYLKLLGKIPLLQKGILTISREGFPVFFARTKRYLRKNKDVATMGLIESDYDKWIRKNQLTDEMIGKIKREITRFEYKPKVSIIMPVYNVDQVWLEKAIDSVINQLYQNWELCIVDNASTKKHIKKTLERYSKKENRIRVRYFEENQGIAGASNEAMLMVSGDYIAFLDQGDELAQNALYENVKVINQTGADLIYSDEDKITIDGTYTAPHFKPDYSPDMILSQNYISHLGVYKKIIVDEIGGLRKGVEGSQDYDFLLRFIEKSNKVYHIPKVLYHWRKVPGSPAEVFKSKSYAQEAGRKALEDALKRRGIKGAVENGMHPGTYRVKRKILGDPLISIIIPFNDKPDLLETCIDSIISKSTYNNYEIIGIGNNSIQKETFKVMDKYVVDKRVKFYEYNIPFNFSKINNYAVTLAKGEHIVLLNNDTEVIMPEWLESLLEHSQRPEVGAVGAKLIYQDNTIQHAGVIIAIGGIAGHSHKYMPNDHHGWFSRPHLIQNLSAVTAACLMTKKRVFKEVGGFDENFSHAFNDVDFCLKLREKGYLMVYTPYAELYHHESLSRGHEDTPEKQARFRKEIKLFQGKWKEILANGDPYYNPNLTLDREDFSIKL